MNNLKTRLEKKIPSAPTGRSIIFLLVLMSIIVLQSCSPVQWSETFQPSDQLIARMLGERTEPPGPWDLQLAAGEKSFPLPTDVRPCCPFGFDLKVDVGDIPVPFFRLANTTSPNKIGPHQYGAGVLSRGKDYRTGKSDSENNGLIYTLKGGVVDLAHVRDTADNTVGLFYKIYPNLGKNHTITLPPELGERTIRLHAFPVDRLTPRERWQMSISLSAYMAFLMAAGHELAQWHGYRSFPLWSEEVSAYSVEDLHSNMLGAKIAAQLLHENLATSSMTYNQSMTVWLRRTIHYLIPLSKKGTNAVLAAVDKHWWKSAVPLPNKFMLLKRNYNLSATQPPPHVPLELLKQSKQWDYLESIIDPDIKPLPLSLTTHMYGFKFDDIATFHEKIKKEFQQSFNHVPAVLWQKGINSRTLLRIPLYDRQQDDNYLKKT